MLTWETDPLLVDGEPVPKEQWLTANDLLEQKQPQVFLTSSGQLKLYPFMVRRQDFIRGERILQAMPYLLLNPTWAKKLRKQSLALAERCAYYFADSPAECSIKQWQQKIITYCEKQQRIPFPMFRLAKGWEGFFEGKRRIRFQSARGEDFHLPLDLSTELAYLLGVLMGDGHLSKYAVYLVDSSQAYIHLLKELLEQNFGADILLYSQAQVNAWNLCQKGKWLVRFIHFLTGLNIDQKKTSSLREPCIIRETDHFRPFFWRGLMDTDGSYLTTIAFGSASRSFVKEFQEYLKLKNIHSKTYTIQAKSATGYGLKIRSDCRKAFSKLIGSSHPQKQQELQTLLARKIITSAPRSTAKRRGKTSWKKQVRGFNRKKIVNGVFDFNHLVKYDICVLQSGNYLKKLRLQKGKTQKQIAAKTGISQSLISRYERNEISIPLQSLKKILQAVGGSYSLSPFLNHYNLDQFQKAHTTIRLDLQPSKQLLTLLRGLQLRNGYFLIIRRAELPQREYKVQLRKYFKIPINKNRLSNRILEYYVKEFMILSE